MSSRRRVGLAALVVALVAGAVIVTLLLTRSSQEEIRLEPAASLGPDPFTDGGAVQETTTTQAPPGRTTITQAPPGGTTTTTALFGGSGNLLKCDPEALIAFLTTHPDKAGAWIEVFNSDPTFHWGVNRTKTKLTLVDIPDYIHELTPTHLKFDTRVTNHGYKNGHPTPHQSLLQAGMAVLVDRDGIPRVKCYCGNGLKPPKDVSNPRYVGVCWPGCHDHPPCVGASCAETTTTGPKSTTTICVDTATVNCGGSATTVKRTTTTRSTTTTVATTKPPPTTAPPTTLPRA
jgi:hypothetical protein